MSVVEVLVIIQCSVLAVRSGNTGNVEGRVCRGCMNPVTGTGCTGVDIGVNSNLELVDKFCYLGDILSVDGDADAALETRI